MTHYLTSMIQYSGFDSNKIRLQFPQFRPSKADKMNKSPPNYMFLAVRDTEIKFFV